MLNVFLTLVWCTASSGELGHTDCVARKSFSCSAALTGRGIVSVACGNEHTIALTVCACVCVCVCVCVEGSHVRAMSRVVACNSVCGFEFVILHSAEIATLHRSTLIVLRHLQAWGEVLSFGLNDNGQLGHERSGRVTCASGMVMPPGVEVAQVRARVSGAWACGSRHARMSFSKYLVVGCSLSVGCSRVRALLCCTLREASRVSGFLCLSHPYGSPRCTRTMAASTRCS